MQKLLLFQEMKRCTSGIDAGISVFMPIPWHFNRNHEYVQHPNKPKKTTSIVNGRPTKKPPSKLPSECHIQANVPLFV